VSDAGWRPSVFISMDSAQGYIVNLPRPLTRRDDAGLPITGTAPNPRHIRAWTLGYSKGSGASAPRKTAVQLRPVACLRERALRLRGRAEAELDAARTRSENQRSHQRFQRAKGEPKALDI
jgi:hypothetical protein